MHIKGFWAPSYLCRTALLDCLESERSTYFAQSHNPLMRTLLRTQSNRLSQNWKRELEFHQRTIAVSNTLAVWLHLLGTIQPHRINSPGCSPRILRWNWNFTFGNTLNPHFLWVSYAISHWENLQVPLTSHLLEEGYYIMCFQKYKRWDYTFYTSASSIIASLASRLHLTSTKSISLCNLVHLQHRRL